MQNSGTVVKVIMLGKSNSGKSCLVDRYVLGDFDNHKQSTIGLVHAHNKERIGNQEVRLFIWDTAGCEKYRSLTRMYYRDAVAAVVCYDMTDRSSWEDVPFWIDGIIDKNNCSIYLVGTKMDLLSEKWSRHQRAASAEDIINLITLRSDVIIRRSYETSSRTGENIDIIFRDIANDYADLMKLSSGSHLLSQSTSSLTRSKTIRLEDVKEESNPCCP